MIGFASVESTTEKISQLMDAEIELLDGMARIQKTRIVKLSGGSHYFTTGLDMEISFSLLAEEGPTINEAEILLLPEEFLPFSTALREHANPFPTNFSQRLVQQSGTCSILLKSQESPVQFAERLASALQAISSHN
ncbi:hypothetical protein [Planococcus salinus]|uniref:DUF1259 domain-containing protein n=1 Tax=Planococcus salinus TaxID=1848460 RepID=A0A3M8P9T8_9BACL|nr:hypothetical protein [Planococcus salinus]RNF40413.1 hypothetical protein EEX84_03020 [Planococcus salinus]